MKISSASKKVLASALSAAMVVAFAPTVAFGADLGAGDAPAVDKGEAAVQVTYKDKAGKAQVQKFSATTVDEDYGNGIQGAFDFAAAKGESTVQLLGDITADVTVKSKVTIDLNGYTWTNAGDYKNEAGSIVSMSASPITIGNEGEKTEYKASLIAANATNAPANTVVLAESTDQVTDADVKVKASYATKTEADAFLSLTESNRYEVGGKIYDAVKLAAAPASYAGYYVFSTSKSTTAATTGDLTIKDSSTAKTGKVVGNQVNAKDDGSTTTTATAAVTTNGHALAIKGGTFTTGSDTAVYANGTGAISAIDGAVSSIENATVETVGGSVYVNATTTDVKPQGVAPVVVSGKVKDSTITATAGDATENGGVAARALEVSGNVENSTVTATAGKVSKSKGSTAVAIKAAAAGTYKKVTATATANGLIENQAAKAGEYGATTVTAVDGSATINSGKYTGERKNSPVLKGGEFTKHIASSEIDSANFGTVCLGAGKSDFVFKTLSATATGDFAADAAGTAAKTAFETAVATAANNEVRDAIASAADYKVGVSFAEGYDAAKLAAAATDYDVSQHLSAKADIQAGAAAKKADAGKALTDEQAAFNKALDAVDAAAKQANSVAFSYANATAGISYADPAKASTRGYKGTPVLSITDLGLKYGNASTSGDSHASTTTPTLVANSFNYESALKSSLVSGDAEKGLTTSTKTPATANTFDGTAFAEVAASKVGATTGFYSTKLGTLAVLSTNAGQVKDDVNKGETPSVEIPQTLYTAFSKKTVKAKTLKKKSVALKIKGQAANKVTYKVTKKASKKISVSKAGKVTLKKGAKKGTYKVAVTAAAGNGLKAAKKTVTIVVK